MLLGGTSGQPNQVGSGAKEVNSLDFDRFTEESRRALFFARAAVSLYGGGRMETDHLLLGLLEAAPSSITRFMGADWSVERMQEHLRRNVLRGPTVAESVEIPLSPDLARILVRASREADNLLSQDVRPEHLLLALLDDDVGSDAELLREAGVTRQSVVMFLQQK
jgi:ATP-dependent Clp protease ATP-binding subunit ClpB